MHLKLNRNVFAFTIFLLIRMIPITLAKEKTSIDKSVEIISGDMDQKGKSSKIQMHPYSSYNPYSMMYSNYEVKPEPAWKASAILLSTDPNIEGFTCEINFHQSVPANIVRVTVIGSGLMPGRHAVHIHAFGDLRQGCVSTGPHLQEHFIGNIEVKENGTISAVFFSSFLPIFGYDGVLGRSIVIHTNPFELRTFTDLYPSKVPGRQSSISFETEENSVGPPIACGIITITDNLL